MMAVCKREVTFVIADPGCGALLSMSHTAAGFERKQKWARKSKSVMTQVDRT